MNRSILIVILSLLPGTTPVPCQTLIGDYLGQAPPGPVPRIFAPGILSTRFHEHSAPNFSSAGDMVIYTLSCRHGHTLMMMRRLDNHWTWPEPCSFSGIYSDDGHHWNLAGDTLFFRSRRPLPGNSETDGVYRSWKVSWTEETWGNPIPAGKPAAEATFEGRSFFYKEARNRTDFDIFVMNAAGDVSSVEAVNSPGHDGTVWLPPDESYLLFSSTGHDPIGMMDLFISFKNEEGGWGAPVNLGEPVNGPGLITRFPRISPDGRYLFFWQNRKKDQGDTPLSPWEIHLQPLNPWRPENGRDGDIYWVNASFLEDLKMELERGGESSQ